MSESRRKVAHYALTIRPYRKKEPVSPEQLLQALSHTTALPVVERAEELAENRFMFLESVRTSSSGNLWYLVFSSAKYNFRPPLLHRKTGARRESPKELPEGDECRTHAILQPRENECYLLLEEFKAGVGIANVMAYLKKRLKDYQSENGLSPKHTIDLSVVPQDDFMEQVNAAERITKVIVTAERDIIGTEHLNYSNRTEVVDKDVEVVIRPIRGGSLGGVVQDLVDGITKANRDLEATRIRIESKDFDDNPVTFGAEVDGSQLKLIEHMGKVDFILVRLNQATGETETTDCFRQMRALF